MEIYTERFSRFGAALAICFIALPLLFTIQTALRKPSFDLFGKPNEHMKGNMGQKYPAMDDAIIASSAGRNNTNSDPDAKLLHGLVSPAFEEGSCLSRYQSHLYYKERAFKPSSYLVSKLRDYESLHRRCGPESKSYRNGTDTCKYLVWIAANGLGNRMVSLASAFLYAVMTSRVLLVEFLPEMEGLFCEPFPNSSWLLPNDFPNRNRLHHANQVPTFSSFIAKNPGDDMNPPPFLYLDLHHGIYGDPNLQSFHCDHSQEILNKVRVLVLQTDQYLVPSLFLMPNFKEELRKMFPDNGVVFYHLGHYLFHPSNEAWGLITRFYNAYLAKADEIIGFQIRVFVPQRVPHQTVMDQVMACALQHNVLPELDKGESVNHLLKNQTSRSKAVLVASLYPQYAEEIRLKYWTRPSISGDVIGVYQASHEEFQKFNDNQHNMKALAEIYLLSLSDVLVTSSDSTFGYVAQGLAGLKPWVLVKQRNEKMPKPPCRRDVSMEPCFHIAPKDDCKNNKLNTSALFPPMDHCVDQLLGLKMAMDGLN